MSCPRCRVLCTLGDLTKEEVVYDNGFGREARRKICGACLVEVRGSIIYSKVTRVVRPV